MSFSAEKSGIRGRKRKGKEECEGDWEKKRNSRPSTTQIQDSSDVV